MGADKGGIVWRYTFRQDMDREATDATTYKGARRIGVANEVRCVV